MRRLAAVALVAIACGTVTAHAQTLELGFSKGATYHYSFHLTSDFSIDTGPVTAPVKLDVTAKEAVKVNSVDSSGVADVSITFTDTSVTLTMTSGKATTTTTQTQSALPATDLSIAPDGRVLSINGTSLSGDLMFGLGGIYSLVSAVLPDGLVRPGDTWSKSYGQPNPYGGGSVSVTALSKYLRNETFHGVQAAVVETTSTATIDLSSAPSTQAAGGSPSTAIRGSTTSDVTSWIDPSAHRLLKSTMRSSSDMTLSETAPANETVPGVSGPFTMKGTQTLDLEPA